MNQSRLRVVMLLALAIFGCDACWRTPPPLEGESHFTGDHPLSDLRVRGWAISDGTEVHIRARVLAGAPGELVVLSAGDRLVASIDDFSAPLLPNDSTSALVGTLPANVAAEIRLTFTRGNESLAASIPRPHDFRVTAPPRVNAHLPFDAAVDGADGKLIDVCVWTVPSLGSAAPAACEPDPLTRFEEGAPLGAVTPLGWSCATLAVTGSRARFDVLEMLRAFAANENGPHAPVPWFTNREYCAEATIRQTDPETPAAWIAVPNGSAGEPDQSLTHAAPVDDPVHVVIARRSYFTFKIDPD
jgi:hypothetical protein